MTRALAMISGGNNPTEEDLTFACRLAVKYSKGKDENLVNVKYGLYRSEFNKSKDVIAMTQEELYRYSIN